MATAYFYRIAEQNYGPVGFRELVLLVHQGRLVADDPVRADWEPDFHPAATVVGLFHVAGREDVLIAWELERCRDFNVAASVSEPFVEQQGVRQQHERPVPQVARPFDAVDVVADARDSRERIARAAEEAIGDLDSRRRTEGNARRSSPFSWKPLVHGLFRWGATVAAACLTTWSIQSWSVVQLQRDPDPQMLAAGLNVFPMWGTCARMEYLILLADAAIIAGAVSYFGATVVEGFAED